MRTRLFVAVTSREAERGKEFLDRLSGLPVGIKVGLELFVREGPSFLREIAEGGFPLFLDLKFHDIPFTVAGAVRSACSYGPELINVHASGGIDMMRAAADALQGDTRILAVTVLTSLSKDDLGLLGFHGNPSELVKKMTLSARDSGMDGVVCSPREARLVRQAAGPGFLIVTPGIRPAGSSSDDQKRISTPSQAILDGASALVVGRPITLSEDPGKAAEAILREVDQALSEK